MKIKDNLTKPQKIVKALLLDIEKGKHQTKEKFPSIRELSKKFGVSKHTISQALAILESQRIISKKQSKGVYLANPGESGPRNLQKPPHKARAKPSLGIIIPHLKISFFSDILAGVEEMGYRNGYQTLLCNTSENVERESKQIRGLLAHDVAGIVVVAGRHSKRNNLYRKIDKKIPLVVMDVFLEGVLGDFITSDNRQGAYKAVKHLMELGHEKIAHLAGTEIDVAEKRLEGYRLALEGSGITIDQELIRQTGWHQETGYQETKKLLLNGSNKITAIFACNDEIAVGASKAIRELGKRIPEDIALVGFGNLHMGLLLESPLTTVDQAPINMGNQAVELLMEKIKGVRPIEDTKKELFPTELVVRESCGIKAKPVMKK